MTIGRAGRRTEKPAAVILIGLMAMLLCTFGMTACGSRTEQPEQAKQDEQMEIHVAADGSDETGNGTTEAPYATITRADAGFSDRRPWRRLWSGQAGRCLFRDRRFPDSHPGG